MNKNNLKLFITTLLLMPITTYLFCQSFDASTGVRWIVGFVTAVMVVLTFVYTVDITVFGDTEAPTIPVLKKFKSWLIILFIISLIPYKQPVAFHNQAVVGYNTFIQVTKQKPAFYDKMYKTYTQKKEIGFINQEQFTKIATIIMDNKKDGQALTWKWISEQKVIPFEEFSSFWKDLSSFIETQREAYYALEVQCNQLANSYNISLQTFPNNVYNIFLRHPHAVYTYGFTSDKTEQVFKTGKENL